LKDLKGIKELEGLKGLEELAGFEGLTGISIQKSGLLKSVAIASISFESLPSGLFIHPLTLRYSGSGQFHQ